MKRALIFILFFISTNLLIAQKSTKACVDTIEADISHDSIGDDDHVVKDSSKKELRLVFEQNFNDKTTILLNDSLFTTSIFKTEKNLGVCLNIISIDYSAFKKIPKISIILSSKDECISFYPRIGERIAYINHIEGAWSIELSNVLRDYR
jgi:hypothetical protein